MSRTPKSTEGVAESRELKAFGYRQELDRSLGSFSSFAAGFSYISILTGMFQTFFLGFHAGGPGFFWSWPLVVAGQLTVALCFAELAAKYPIAGGVYQWSKYAGSPFLGWLTGWVYLACLVVTLSAVALALQNSLPQIWPGFQLQGDVNDPLASAQNAVVFGCLLILFSTFINTVGVGLLARLNNVGVFCELAGILALIVGFAWYAKRGPFPALAVPRDTNYLGPFLTSTALTASYVLFGFDTAGTLAEETTEPRVRAPRAILRAVVAAGAAGFLLLLFALLAVGSLRAPELQLQSGGLGFIVREALGETWGKFFLADVVFAVVVCALAVHSGAVRLIFSMARDGHLPFAESLARVSEQSRVPVVPALICGILSFGLLVVNLGYPKIVELITSIAALWANLAYFLVVTSLWFRRTRGEWRSAREFRLPAIAGGIVNSLAVVWSAFMVVNIAWPRAEVYGENAWFRWSPCWMTFGLVTFGAVYYGLRPWFARFRAVELRGRESLPLA